MSEELVIHLARETIMMVLLISAPALVVGLVVGLVISIFQAATQIQEQTLTFVPKIIAIFLALLISASWILNMITGFTENILGNLSSFIR